MFKKIKIKKVKTKKIVFFSVEKNMKKLLYKNKQGNATMKNTFKISKSFSQRERKRI